MDAGRANNAHQAAAEWCREEGYRAHERRAPTWLFDVAVVIVAAVVLRVR